MKMVTLSHKTVIIFMI